MTDPTSSPGTSPGTNPAAGGADLLTLKGSIAMVANMAIYTTPNAREPDIEAGEEFKASEEQALDLEKSGAARRKESAAVAPKKKAK